MLNSAKVRSKNSSIENMMNKQIVTIFLMQVVICAFCGVYYVIWYSANKDKAFYLSLNSAEQNLLGQFVVTFFT